MKNHYFLKSELLGTFNNWKLEPLTLKEREYLYNEIMNQEMHSYGQDDKESYLLELLSEIEN